MKVGLIFGTRPEAIKMAPLYHALKRSGIDAKVIATAQHREMLDQVLEIFGIKADYDLNIMKDRQTLSGLTARLCESLEPVLSDAGFDWLLTQGDTTSTFVGSLISFYHKIPVGHVEAGLRSNERYDPFPEEINRRLTSHLAGFHFAPTERAKQNLLNEGVDDDLITITGNTVIDALKWIVSRKSDKLDRVIETMGLTDKRYLLMTMHRRENHGERMKETMKAVKSVLNRYPDIRLVFPVHYNPAVRDVVYPELAGHQQVILTEPAEYLEFIALMRDAFLILSDSGGVQEEAPTLGKPVLVLRETTERPEAVSSGVAKLIGTTRKSVYENTCSLIEDERLYSEMSRASNPFGDGKASERITDVLLRGHGKD